MNPVAESALKTVAVEQCHEELKILFLAIVWRRRHQQEMARERREQLAEPVALGVLRLATEDGRRHLVCFVADHEVPATVRRLQFLLNVLVSRELVQASDDQIGFKEPVTGARGFKFVVGQNFKWQMETPVQFVLPLFG